MDEYIISDYEATRGAGTFSILHMFIALLLDPHFKYMFWFRKTRKYYCAGKRIRFRVSQLFLKHYQFKYGCEISYKTDIGKYVKITHPFGIVVFAERIGDHAWFHTGCVIGQAHNGRGDIPTIGNNVSFGAGCKVMGNITIGDNVIIGTNAVVVKDVPSNSIVAGNPARVIGTCDGVWG